LWALLIRRDAALEAIRRSAEVFEIDPMGVRIEVANI